MKNAGIFTVSKLLLIVFTLISSCIIRAQNVDINILKAINNNRNTQFDPFFRSFSKSVTPVAFAVPSVVLGEQLLRKEATPWRQFAVTSAALVSASAVTTLLKYSIERDRPYVTYPFIEKAGEGGSPSFPSGHTTSAFASATSLTLMYKKWYVAVPAYAWAATSAYSRMHLGVHYPSDVLAGALIGSGCAWLTFYLNKKLLKK